MGDVWPSVAASLTRKLLTTLNKRHLTERNWRANILLFSGGQSNRPYLIEFGRWLVGKHGLISNFDLVLNKTSKLLFPKNQQAIPESEKKDSEGVFSRRQECNNIYQGIENISTTYGFSGVEPNTVVLGWGRQTEDPVRFAKMLRHLSDLDLNIVLLDYDQGKGFGKFQHIDVWWRGGSNNGNLILSLIKFLRISYLWRNATVRLMLINYSEKRTEIIRKEAKAALDNMRMDAEVKVINNEIEKRPVNLIIKEESASADLIFLGLADVQDGKEKEYLEGAKKYLTDIFSCDIDISIATEKGIYDPANKSKFAVPLRPAIYIE